MFRSVGFLSNASVNERLGFNSSRLAVVENTGTELSHFFCVFIRFLCGCNFICQDFFTVYKKPSFIVFKAHLRKGRDLNC